MSNNSYYNDAWRIINEKNQSLVSNYSMEFDPANSEKVDIGIAPAPFNVDATDFSISCWVKSTQFGVAGSNFTLFANSPSPFTVNGIYVRSAGATLTVGLGSAGNAYLPAANFSTTDWNHLVITLTSSGDNADRCKIYLNNVVDDNAIGTNPVPLSSSTPFTIGSRNGAIPIPGSIDQFCMFDYTLSASQVATLYGGGTAVTNPMSLSPAPIAYYQLGDQTASNNTTEPTPPVQSYLVPNNSLQDYVFNLITGDYISFANGSTMARQQNISYSAWVNTTNLSTTQYIVGNNTSSNQGTSIFILNSASYPDRLVFQFGDPVNFNNQSYFNSIVSNLSTYVSANEWFHVAASWDGTTSKIYINGIERNSWTPTQPPAYTISNWGSFRIGRRGDSAGSYFNGMLSNVAFWDNGLTPSQVTKLYNNGVPGDISSLSPVSWWKLNAQDTFDGTIWTIKDYAGSNDGTSNGMTSANLITSDLQHTSGYSPYALSLDSNDANQLILNNGGNAILNGATSLTVSAWINPTADTGSPQNIFTNWAGNIMIRFASAEEIQVYLNGVSPSIPATANGTITFGEWQHIVVTYSGSEVKIYRNNILIQTSSATGTLGTSAGTDVIGNRPNTTQYFNGKMSNVAVWKNSVIDVNTLYNQGVPADLTSLSPTGWWQLGSNSSFNSGVWTCLNQGTGSTSAVPANATSTNTMTNDDITNGPGYSANGLGTSSIDIVGDAPYSTANGLSENMDVLDRVRDVAPFVVIDNSLQFTVQMGAGETFVFPGSNGAAVFKIDWGQGAGFQDVTGTNNTSPAYATAGLYTVRVFDATTINFHASTAANKAKIRALQNWGDSTWITLVNSFRNIPNLTITATDYPDLSTATDLQYSFHGSPFPGSTNFTGWDVSNIRTFNNMFTNTLPSGSIDLSNWDMSSATNINSMISGVDGDVGDITGWDVSNVTGTGFANFINANTFFNQDISSWDASNATNLVNFLRGTAFNQNMGTLSLGAGLITMQYMCYVNGMNTDNYTDTFVGFANQVKTNGFPYNVNAANQNGRTYKNSRPGGSNFINAAAARTFLTSSVASGGAGWSISSDTVIN